MSEASDATEPAGGQAAPIAADAPEQTEKLDKIRADFQSRLILANLRTEAVQAGIVDLDGLKLIDLSSAQLGADDKVIGSRQIMDDLRRRKPWLFNALSSSSTIPTPAFQPARQKSAREMTDDEYAAARATLVKRHI